MLKSWFLLFTILVLAACTPPSATSPASSSPTTDHPQAAPPGGQPPAAVSIPFKTIAQGILPGNGPGEPFYAILAAPEDWHALAGRLPERLAAAGSLAAQASDDLLVVALDEMKESSGYSLTITGIVQNGSQITVTLKRGEPGEGQRVEPATALPYHLAAFPRASLPHTGAWPVVIVDEKGNILSKTSLTLP